MGRKCKNFPYFAANSEDNALTAAHRGAEKTEVKPAAKEHCHPYVDLHFPACQLYGVAQNAYRHRHPVGHVYETPPHLSLPQKPKKPQKIVAKRHPRPHTHRARKGRRLLGRQVSKPQSQRLHHRNSRLSKPPRASLTSS